MNKRAHLMIVGLMLFITMAVAQEIPSGLVNAFKHGNAQELSPYLENKVEIIQSDVSKDYNQEETIRFIANFFILNKVKSFVVNHQGNRNESGFIVGMLSTGKTTFRINVFFKKKENSYLIHQIRIDKTNE